MMRRLIGLAAVCTFGMLLNLTALAAEFSPALDAELATKKDGEFVSAVVILESPIDIRALDDKLHADKATKVVRYRSVIEALHYNAESTQPAFKMELDNALAQGRVEGYTAYWIEDLFVIKATKDFIVSLRERGDIRYVTENFKAELIEPIPSDRTDDPRRDRHSLDTRTVTPGVVAVGAVRVVEELGYTGAGVLVGHCDTGVDGTHPALASRWRGLHAPWYHCWMDNLGTGTTSPNDGHYHGTHVMGTITGLAISGSDSTWIGIAPQAEWVACNAINQGVGSGFDNDIIAVYQWYANPDSNINTMDDVPDVVQNSWGVNTSLGYIQCFDYWNTVVLNCEAAGVVVTWSAGNEASSGLRSPAIYSINETQIFSVGALDATNYSAPYPIASFSSRGPTPCTPYSPNNIKPEISAPGVDVWSAQPGGGYQYLDGTSMAGPHVAGVVALMREACPDCDPTTIKQAIIQTAIRTGYVTPPATENNIFGNGMIDAYEAVLAVAGNHGRVEGTVRDAATLTPLPATVSVVGGPQNTIASAAGFYSMNLPADSNYTLRFEYYGYVSQDIPVTVLTDDTTTQDANLNARPMLTVLSEDFEDGAPDWTHETPGGTWIDQWHISSEIAHGGTSAYKCGDTGTGTYGNYNDARLVSPVVSSIPEDARLRFWYQIESELSVAYSDSAYDGGVLEMSLNGAEFAQIYPTVAYPKTFRYNRGGGNPATGPMRGNRCWAGSITTWTEAAFDLSAYQGQSVQFRWRFGSDQSGGLEGWYVDDVVVSGFGTGTAVMPTSVVITVSGQDLILSWDDVGSTSYRIYSDSDPSGTYSTLVDQTANTTYTITDGVLGPDKLFYVVQGWDGQ